MQEFIINMINQLGYLGIFLLVVIENIFPPIPSEFILIFAGVFTTYTSLSCSSVILYATLGSLVGAYILYFVGFLLNKERLKRFVESKIGRMLRLKVADVEKADTFFVNRGNKAVFFCRFVPIVRSLISIPAGMSRMPLFRFTIYTTIATVIWNFVLVFLGSVVGSNWNHVVTFFSNYSSLVRIFLIFLFLYLLFLLFKRKKS